MIKYQFHEQGTKVAPVVLPAMGGREHGWAEAGPSNIPGELTRAKVDGPVSLKSLLGAVSEHGWFRRHCRTS